MKGGILICPMSVNSLTPTLLAKFKNMSRRVEEAYPPPEKIPRRDKKDNNPPCLSKSSQRGKELSCW